MPACWAALVAHLANTRAVHPQVVVHFRRSAEPPGVGGRGGSGVVPQAAQQQLEDHVVARRPCNPPGIIAISLFVHTAYIYIYTHIYIYIYNIFP
jgi:hypothetical protein